MPWAPREDATSEIRDARLDPFRERAGVLQGIGEGSGLRVFLRAETHWARVSGHLWWSRWSAPYEAIHCYARGADGRVAEWLCAGADLDVDLDRWRNGYFRYAGRTCGVQWQDDADARRIREAFFDPPNAPTTSPAIQHPLT